MKVLQHIFFTSYAPVGIPSLGVLVLCLIVIACGGQDEDQSEAATREDCAAVRAHMADLRITAVEKNSALSKSELAKHRANLSRMNEDTLNSCADSRSQAWVQCMLALTQSQEVKTCE